MTMPESPCTTCTTLADCSCCVEYGEYRHWMHEHPVQECTTCVDADWLTMSGELFPQIAARLHMKPVSLARHLHRHGRPDLAPKRQLA